MKYCSNYLIKMVGNWNTDYDKLNRYAATKIDEMSNINTIKE